MSVLDDRIWTWFNRRIALYITDAIFGDCILIGGHSSSGVNGITQYILSTGIAQNYLYNSMLEADDHDNPGLVMHPDGYLCYAESTHNTNSSWSRTALVANSGYMGPKITVGSEDSYCRLFAPSTTAKELIWFFRNNPLNPRPQSYRISTDRGATWGSEVSLFDVASQRPYFLDCEDDTDNRIIHHFLTNCQPGEGASSIYYFKTIVANDGTMTRWKSDGTQITAALPLTTSDVELIDDGTSVDGWIWDVRCYSGVPYLYYVKFTSSNTIHTYKRAIVNNGTITISTIATGGDVANHYLYTTAPQYSGGLSGDPNNADQCFVSRKQGTGNWQMYRYTFSSGTWSVAQNISGDTGNFNCRPFAISDGNGQTYVVYWRATDYTTYNSFAGGSVIFKVGVGELAAKNYTPVPKPTSQAWQGGSLVPPGAVLYASCQEGTGTPVDFKPSGHTITNVGSGPTWGRDAFGWYLTNFTVSNHLSLGNVATINPTVNQTNMMWVMFSNTNTANQVLIALGRSTTNVPAYSLMINNGSTGIVSGFVRDDANTLIALNSAATIPCNNGDINVLLIASHQGCMRLFFNDAIVANNLNTLGTTTLDRFRVGVLQRTGAATLPFLGKIYAFGAMVGSIPDPLKFIHDLRTGNFTAVRAAAATVGSSFGRRRRSGTRSTLVRM